MQNLFKLSSECYLQDDHLYGKPGNVRDFDSCQQNLRDFTKSQANIHGKCQEKNLVRENWPKTVYC